MRRRWALLVAMGMVIAACSASSGPQAAPARRAAAAVPPPNVLLVVTDDQPLSMFTRELMPGTFARMVDKGVNFTRAYVNTPICCPSRAEILTGLYQHHNEVWFQSSPLKVPTFVPTLHDMGYRTVMAGKYLNSHPCDQPRPEFDRWVCQGEGTINGVDAYSLKDPVLFSDGAWSQRTGYTTELLADEIVSFIGATPSTQPFFALYAPTSPHKPANDDRYASLPVAAWRPPSYDEDTLAASARKPHYMQRGPMTDWEKYATDIDHTKMARSVRALDDSVSRLLDSLGTRKKSTIVFFLSDNGYLFGEHRRWAKLVPYDEAIHVPFAVRYPALFPGGSTSSAPVSNVDIAATLEELIGFDWSTDGQSLVPLLTGGTASREGVLVEYCAGSAFLCPEGFGFGQTTPPGYWAVVTAEWKYVEYGTGERELYRLATDPFELNNRAGSSRYVDVETQLAALLFQLRSAAPR